MKPIFPKPATSSCQIKRSRDRHIKRSQDCHIERSRDCHIERSRDRHIERSRDRQTERSRDCHIERSRDRQTERSRDSFSLAFDSAQGDISGITNFFEPLICHIELACAELSRSIETLSYRAKSR